MERDILAYNRRARFDYEILDSFEAGIELLGFEVKSAKLGRINLIGSYAKVLSGELWLINADIQPFQPKNAPENYDPTRSRRLLINKAELRKLLGKLEQERLTLVPLRAITKRNLIKIELGLGKSRKKVDKREVIKTREAFKEMRRAKK